MDDHGPFVDDPPFKIQTLLTIIVVFFIAMLDYQSVFFADQQHFGTSYALFIDKPLGTKTYKVQYLCRIQKTCTNIE